MQMFMVLWLLQDQDGQNLTSILLRMTLPLPPSDNSLYCLIPPPCGHGSDMCNVKASMKLVAILHHVGFVELPTFLFLVNG